MATLSVIGEPLVGFESKLHAAAARDLAGALNEVAPRGCVAEFVVAADTDPSSFADRTPVAQLSHRATSLPFRWRTSASTRPPAHEMMHAITPLAPLRGGNYEGAAQSSVFIPHALPWVAPNMLSAAESRTYRAFTRRAVKHADLLLAPTHAVAAALTAVFGPDTPVHVLPLAAPSEFLRPADSSAAAARRTELGLPDRYFVTTASASETGRLDWVLSALRTHTELPPVVVINTAELTDPLDVPDDLRDRVIPLNPTRLSDVGIALSGAIVFACPQQVAGTAYELYAAIHSGVPVVHSECLVAAEVVLDAGMVSTNPEEFAAAVAELCENEALHATASVLAEDRSRAFRWRQTAWQLWELHANA